jgi:hypothetical protein
MMIDNRLRALLVFVLATACSRAPASSASQTTAGGSTYGSPVIVAWLDCVECTPDQLRAVATLGDRAVPAFRDTLLNGPPQDRLDREQKHLETTYAAMKEYERQHPDSRVPFTQQEYVQLYTQKYVLLNKMRSARALGAIATVAARDSLKSAQQRPNLPDDLRSEIARALGPQIP